MCMKTRSDHDDFKKVLKCLAFSWTATLSLWLKSYKHYRRFLLHLKIDLFVGKSSKITKQNKNKLDHWTRNAHSITFIKPHILRGRRHKKDITFIFSVCGASTFQLGLRINYQPPFKITLESHFKANSISAKTHIVYIIVNILRFGPNFRNRPAYLNVFVKMMFVLWSRELHHQVVPKNYSLFQHAGD